MNAGNNPFPEDSHRREIWTMLVERDIAAFVAGDWSRIEDDFIAEGFHGVDGRRSDLPDTWRLGFPDLDSYRETWLAQSRAMAERAGRQSILAGLLAATTLRDIEIVGDSAIAHKKFDGEILLTDGGRERLLWQTLYRCRRIQGRWRIASFIGYLPNPMGGCSPQPPPAAPPGHTKRLPPGAAQHVTAGPYSPVLEVSAQDLVVISGQAAIAADGSVQGDEVRTQAEFTLDNCLRQLSTAGCTFEDVFKVNVYLADLGQWDEFNQIYSARMPAPRPVRTAVQAALLPGLLVEVEMWAVKPRE